MIAAAPTTLRQQLLFLYLEHPSPAARVIGWSCFDGASDQEHGSGDADGDEAPYDSVVGAMREGWRVIQVASQHPPALGLEQRTSFLAYEFVLERMTEVSHA
jgi:hypothetical protein